jgi:hypothetical protein
MLRKNQPEPEIPTPEPPSRPEPTPRLQRDCPKGDDSLGRRPLARCIAGKLEGLADLDGAFFIHIDSPSGAGKSSFLELLRQELVTEDSVPGGGWHVVSLKAAGIAESNPVWWSLADAVSRGLHREAVEARSGRSGAIWRAQYVWRITAGHGQLYFGIAMAAIFLLLLQFAEPFALPIVLQLIAGIFAVGGAFLGVRESLLSRPRRSSVGGDRIGVTEHLGGLIRKSGRRVAIFLDDLDQCGEVQGCELLRALGAILRDLPATVVVGADRRWLLTALERNAGMFADRMAEPGRPLGYQALTRLFQLSVSLPRVRAGVAAQHWRNQIEGPELEDSTALAPVPGCPRCLTESEYQNLGRVLDQHPRTMKRFPQAYAVMQTLMADADPALTAQHIAGWTIVCLRWPLLAEYLAEHPKNVAQFRYDAPPADAPDSVRGLFVRSQIVTIMRGLTSGTAFDERTIRLLTDPFVNGGSRLGVA